MTRQDKTNEVVRMEQAITEAISRETGDDIGNIEPGSWVMMSTIASTIEEGDIDTALDLCIAAQRMTAEEVVGLQL